MTYVLKFDILYIGSHSRFCPRIKSRGNKGRTTFESSKKVNCTYDTNYTHDGNATSIITSKYSYALHLKACVLFELCLCKLSLAAYYLLSHPYSAIIKMKEAATAATPDNIRVLTRENLKECITRCHSSSTSLKSASPTVSDSGDDSDDSDYGLFEDFEDMPISCSSTPPTSSLTSRTTSCSDLQRLRNAPSIPSEVVPDLSRTIIYTVKNHHSHTSCRSFDKTLNSNSSLSNVPVRISMTGVRIVQDSIGMHAEFFVKMSIGLDDYTGWKTHDDFKEIANACLEFSSKKKSLPWGSFFLRPIKKENRYRVSRSTRLTMTLLAWENVLYVSSRRYWFGQLSVCSLMAESNALERFLESLLFEIPDADILIEFLNPN